MSKIFLLKSPRKTSDKPKMYVLYFGLISEILQKFTTLKRTIFHATFQEKKSISDSQQFHTNVEDIVAFYA